MTMKFLNKSKLLILQNLKKIHQSKHLLYTSCSLLALIPIGFYTKFYKGPARLWVHNSLGGVFYEVFWCLFISLFFRKSRAWILATIVLFMTCVVEFLQLYSTPLLELARSSFLGQTLLGNSFSWSDFPYYFVGSFLGWMWLCYLKTIVREKKYI